MAEEQKHQFPTEIIDLPSEGKLYPKDSPISNGKLEVKYMTAKEEDILTSQNLIKKGVVLEKLLESLIVTEGVSVDDLLLGDKNAVLIAARILAYGPEYTCSIQNPFGDNLIEHTFNLADCPFVKPKKIPDDGNLFDFELPVSKKKIKFKLLTGKDEVELQEILKGYEKSGIQINKELTTRLKICIVEVEGSSEKGVINSSVDNMLSRDSLSLREYIKEVTPDIEMVQEIDIEGETVKVDIPMTVNFFWPAAGT